MLTTKSAKSMIGDICGMECMADPNWVKKLGETI